MSFFGWVGQTAVSARHTMSQSRDVTAISAMIGSELLLAMVNTTVKWAGSWPATRIMLVRLPSHPTLALTLTHP